MRRSAFALIFILLATSAGAVDCSMDLEAEEAKVRAARTCGEAHKIFVSCLWGSTADIQRGAMVTAKCEAVFLSALPTAQANAYRRKIEACGKKYARKDGTMYRSMAATCAADAAHANWLKFGAGN
ncbi:hypothetical protein LG047_08340 [Methylocystis sp. WRRC1]|uniref:hypothetical protein n=1 Tax=Methylocystis sp. WRRC1 TaxID=1732014 RepID=UPI001D137137|nr:hypothetical protein [Methylocystis sp. WRRC1]MCC3245331.1 hypothetical protein [Methylocystis sp. WRRC1]